MKYSTRTIATIGLMVALTVVLTRFASIRISVGGTEGIRIGFGAFPTILAGLMMGPLAGAAVGALGDVIGFIISPMGPYIPHFTVTAALTGFLPPLLWRLFGKGVRFWPVLGAIVGGQTITSLILVPCLIRHFFGLPFATTLPGAVISLALTAPLCSVLTLRLHRTLVPSAASAKR